LVVLGRYTGSGRATLTLTGTMAGEPRRFTLTRSFPEQDADREFLPRLWAVRRVGHLLDQIRLHGESQELRDEAATGTSSRSCSWSATPRRTWTTTRTSAIPRSARWP
ncbi:MAG: hypothetical protein ACK6CT_09185, partial [Planctomycetia bacterium]